MERAKAERATLKADLPKKQVRFALGGRNTKKYYRRRNKRKTKHYKKKTKRYTKKRNNYY